MFAFFVVLMSIWLVWVIFNLCIVIPCQHFAAQHRFRKTCREIDRHHGRIPPAQPLIKDLVSACSWAGIALLVFAVGVGLMAIIAPTGA